MTTSKALPARPSLEFLRKQAKKLTREFAAGNSDAIERVRTQLPGSEPPLSLRDAQLVLARELKQLAEHPALLSWRGTRDGVLGYAVDAYGDAFDPKRELTFTPGNARSF